MNNVNATVQWTVAGEGLTEPNNYFCLRQKCRQIWPVPSYENLLQHNGFFVLYRKRREDDLQNNEDSLHDVTGSETLISKQSQSKLTFKFGGCVAVHGFVLTLVVKEINVICNTVDKVSLQSIVMQINQLIDKFCLLFYD